MFALVLCGLIGVAVVAQDQKKSRAPNATIVSFTKDAIIYTRGAGDPRSEYEAPLGSVRIHAINFPQIKGKRLISIWATPVDNIPDMRVVSRLTVTPGTDNTISLTVVGTGATAGRVRVRIHALCETK
jgi:hypothetical protein